MAHQWVPRRKGGHGRRLHEEEHAKSQQRLGTHRVTRDNLEHVTRRACRRARGLSSQTARLRKSAQEGEGMCTGCSRGATKQGGTRSRTRLLQLESTGRPHAPGYIPRAPAFTDRMGSGGLSLLGRGTRASHGGHRPRHRPRRWLHETAGAACPPSIHLGPSRRTLRLRPPASSPHHPLLPRDHQIQSPPPSAR